MTQTLRVSQASEVLSLIPFQLGFWPHGSIVLVSLRGERRRIGLVARADLADLTSQEGKALAEQMLELCRADGAHSLVVATYAHNENSIEPDETPRGHTGSTPDTETTLQTNHSAAIDTLSSNQASPTNSFGTKHATGFEQAQSALSTLLLANHADLDMTEAWHIDDSTYTPWQWGEMSSCPRHSLDVSTAHPAQGMLAESDSFSDLGGALDSNGKEEPSTLSEINPSTRLSQLQLCERHSKPISDFSSTMVSAHMVYEGRTLAAHRARVAVINPSDPIRRAHAAQAMANAEAELSSCDTQESISARYAVWLTAWQNCINGESADQGPQCPELSGLDPSGLDPSGLDPNATGMLAAALADVQFRDAVLISMTPLGIQGAVSFLGITDSHPTRAEGEAVHRRHRDEIARKALGFILDPTSSIRPNTEIMRASTLAFERIIADTPAHAHLAPRTLLGLINWWQGNGVVARRHIEEAHSIKWDDNLSRLVMTALDHGLAPGWQRR